MFVITYKGQQHRVSDPEKADNSEACARMMVKLWLNHGPDPDIRVDWKKNVLGILCPITAIERTDIVEHLEGFAAIYNAGGRRG